MGKAKIFTIVISVLCAVVAAGVAAFFFLGPKQESYKVTFYGDPSIVAYLYGDGEYEKGDEVTLIAQEKPGYSFESWLKDDVVVSYESTYIFIMDEETRGNYTATYLPKGFSITAVQQNGQFNVTQDAKVGELVQVSNVVADPGYQPDRMYYMVEGKDQKVTIKNSSFVMPVGNVSIYVEFVPITYTIEYVYEDDVVINDLVYEYDIETNTFTLPIPMRTGYVFEGWTGTDQPEPKVALMIAKGSIGDRVYTANWQKELYSITIADSVGGTIAVDAEAYYQDEVTITVNPETGYLLTAIYYMLPGDDNQYELDLTFAMPAGDITIYPIFEQVLYSVSKDPDLTNGNISLSRLGANLGDLVVVTVTTDSGYELVRTWYVMEDTDVEVDFTYSFNMPAGSVTVYAQVEPIAYTIDYILDGGTLPQDSPTKYYVWDSFDLPIPTRTGHIFEKWTIIKGGEVQNIAYIEQGTTGNMELTAVWAKEVYLIEFKNEDGTLLYAANVEFGDLPTYSNSLPTKASTNTHHYIFSGWDPEVYPADKAQIYTAQFEEVERTYTVQFNANGGTSVDSEKYKYGDTLSNLSSKVTTRQGYNFLGWYTAINGGFKVSSETQVLQDITYHAKWSAATYSITLELDGGSVSGNNPITYTILDNDFTLPTPTKEGCNFSGWQLQGSASVETTVTIQKGSFGDKTYIAKWDTKTFTIVWKNYDETILETDVVEYGTMPTYDGETPEREMDNEFTFHFNGWDPEVSEATCDIEYTATFASQNRSFTITFDSMGGNAIADDSRHYGDPFITLPTPTREGYSFYAWFTSPTGGTQVKEEDIVTEDITLYARWDTVTYSIAYNLDGGSLTGQPISYNIETPTFTLPTPTKEAYDFAGWTGTGLTNSSMTVSIAKGSTGHRTYTATWTKTVYNVVVSHLVNGSVDVVSTATKGDLVTVTISPDAGYVVDEQYYLISGDETKHPFTSGITMPANNIRIYVTFVEELYTIELLTIENGVVTVSTESAYYGDEVTITTAPDDHYYLDTVWYQSATGNPVYITDNKFTMPYYNIFIGAEFIGPYYSLTVVEDEQYDIGITVKDSQGTLLATSGETITVLVGEYLTIETFSNQEGLEDVGFVGELIGADHTWAAPLSGVFAMEEYDVFLRVDYNLKIYNITLQDCDNGSITVANSADFDSQVNLTVTPDAGYSLSALYYIDDNGESVDIVGSTFTMPASDITIYAEFSNETYTITKLPTSHGTYTVSQTTANYQDEIFLEFSPEDGYYAYEVYYETSSSMNPIYEYSFSMPAEDVVIHVCFEKYRYTIDLPHLEGVIDIRLEGVQSDGSSWIIEGNVTSSYVEWGQTANIFFNFEEGYLNDNSYLYYYDLMDPSNITRIFDDKFIMPQYNVVIGAHLVANVYTLTLSGSSDAGEVEVVDENGDTVATMGDSIEVAYGTQLKWILKNPVMGYDLEVRDSGVYIERDTYFTMPNNDVSLEVTTYMHTYFINSGAYEHGSVFVPSMGYYGETVYCDVEPNEGYELTELYYTKNGDTSNARYDITGDSFTMPACDITIYATFAEIYEFTVDDYTYRNMGNNQAQVVSFHNSSITETTIPDEVEYKGTTFSVVALIDGVFDNETTLLTVNIGANITSIDYAQFNGSSVVNINIADDNSVYTDLNINAIFTKEDLVLICACDGTIADGNTAYNAVGPYAFRGVYNAGQVVLPNGLTSIGAYAFDNSDLTSISLPESLTYIDMNAFNDTDNLDIIILPASARLSIDALNGYYGDVCIKNASTYTSATIDNTTTKSNFDHLSAVYILRAIDNGTSSYFNDKTRFPYVYPKEIVDGVTYNLYSTTARETTNFHVESNDNSLGTAAWEGGYYIGNSITITAAPTTGNIFLGWKTALDATNYVTSDLEYTFTVNNNTPSVYYAIFATATSEVTVGDYTYTLNNSTKTATVKKYNNTTATTASVPSTVSTDLGLYTVNTIGQSAFYDKKALTQVTLPSTIKVISGGDNSSAGAFSNCQSLKTINIPEGVVTIGNSAFWQCESLEVVNIPSTTSYIGTSAFGYCPKITTITVASGNAEYDSRNNCNAIISKTNSLNISLIVGCKNTVIPSDIHSIGMWAFQYCTELTSITIPEGIKSIEYGAFVGCYNLATVNISSSVTYIDDTYNPFVHCSNLSIITVASGNEVYDSRDNCNAIIKTATNTLISGSINTCIPESVEIINQNAFNGIKITQVNIPVSVKEIGSQAFYNSSKSLKTVYLYSSTIASKLDGEESCGDLIKNANDIYVAPSIDNQLNSYVKTNYTYQYTGVIVDGKKYNLYSKQEHTDTVTFVVASNDVSLGTASYSGDFNLGNTISLAATPIGSNIFLGWKNNLSDTTYFATTQEYTFVVEANSPAIYYAIFVAPTGENTIGDYTYTFNNATKTATVKKFNNTTATSTTVPQTVVENNITYTVTEIGDSAFVSNWKIDYITLPNTITKIGSNAFGDCRGLQSINLPEGLIEIGSSAFAICYSLDELILPTTLQKIGDEAFQNTAFDSMNIPKNVSSIGTGLFSYTYSTLKTITVDSQNQYYEDRGLNAIVEKATNKIIAACPGTTLDSTIQSIGTQAFYAINISSINIPGSVESIGYKAFNYAEISTITLNEGLKTISSGAFSNNKKITSITIPSTVTNCVSNFIEGCELLKTIYIKRETIYPVFTADVFGSCFDYLEDIYILSSIDDGTNTYLSNTTNYPYQYENVLVDGVSYNLYSKVEHTDVEYNIVVESNDVTLGTASYSGTAKVGNNISLAATPTSGNTFLGWKANLSDTTYLSTLKTYVFVFKADTSKTFYAIFAPATSEITVGDYTYTLNNSTKKATVKKFNNTTATTTSVPSTVDGDYGTYTVDTIGKASFMSKYNLTQVTLPSTIKTIDGGSSNSSQGAFNGCSKLKTINIPNSVESIYGFAFWECNALESITIPANVRRIGTSIFGHCDSLTSITVASGNSVYDSRDNCNAIIEKSTNTLVAGCKTSTIPNSIKIIGSYAFSSCELLESIIIPEGVETIKSSAFASCYALESIIIPASVQSIASTSFAFCTSMESIIVASGNTVYDSRNNCNAIIETATNVLLSGCKATIVPDGIVAFGSNAFSQYNMESVYIPASLETVEQYTFSNASVPVVYLHSSVIAAALTSETACGGLMRFLKDIYVDPVIDSSLNNFVKTNYIYQYKDIVANGKIYNLYSKVEHTDLEYSIVVESNDLTLGTASYSGTFKNGNKVTLAATPLTGGIFLGWKTDLSDTTYLSTNQEYTFTVAAASSKTYYAVFAASDVTVGDYTYTLDAATKTATVKKFNNSSATTTSVPASIVYSNENYTVDTIGVASFAEKRKLQTITLPNTIKTITGRNNSGEAPFSNCTSLVSINIPNSVKEIGVEGGCFVFYKCTSLDSLSIPASVTRITEGAFVDCRSLKTITVDANNTVYDSRDNSNAIFKTSTDTLVVGCQNTIIPASTKIIGEHAFDGQSEMTEITIPEGVVQIKMNAFASCTSLKSIHIPSTVTAIGGLNQNLNVFEYCSGLETITVASGNTKYDSRNNCNAIMYTSSNTLVSGCKNTIIPDDTNWLLSFSFTGQTELVEITIPSGTIGNYAFSGCENLETVVIGENVTEMHTGVFDYGIEKLKTIVVESAAIAASLSGTDSNNCGAILRYAKYIYVKPEIVSSLHSYVISNFTSKYEGVAFNGGVYTLYSKTVYSPEYFVTVESNDVAMGTASYSGAFKNNTSVTLAATPVSGNICLGWKSSLSDTIYLSTAQEYTFVFTTSSPRTYYAIFAPATSEVTVGDYTYTLNNSTKKATVKKYNNTTATTASVPSTVDGDYGTYTVDTIGQKAFASNSSLEVVSLPASIETIDGGVSYTNSGAFYNCSKLKTVNFSEGLTTINQHAFYDCVALTAIDLPASLVVIKNAAFSGCKNVTTVGIDANNKIYDSRNNCNAIVETSSNTIVAGFATTVIPNTIRHIGTYAFYRQTNLKNLTIPNSVQSISYWALSATGLTSLHLPASVTNMGTIDASSGLEIITVDIDNPKYDSRNNCNAIISTESNTLIVGCKNTIIPENVEVLDTYAFSQKNLTKITIPASVKEVGSNTFYWNTNLKTVYLKSENIASNLNSATGCGHLIYFVKDLYVLPSIDGSLNSYVKTNYTYKYENVNVNGVAYNLYSKVEHNDIEYMPTFSVNASNSALGTVDYVGDFVEGEEITLRARNKSGSYFYGWAIDSVDGGLISKDEDYTFVVEDDTPTNYYALFYTAETMYDEYTEDGWRLTYSIYSDINRATLVEAFDTSEVSVLTELYIPDVVNCGGYDYIIDTCQGNIFGYYAFDGKIYIGKNLTMYSLQNECGTVTGYEVAASNPLLRTDSASTAVYSKDGKTLYAASNATSAIEDGTEIIADYACYNLAVSILIPASVKYIGEYAFYSDGSHHLIVDFEDSMSIETLSPYAFCGCIMGEFIGGEYLTTIPAYSLWTDSTVLINLSYCTNLEVIESYAISCSQDTVLYLPEQVRQMILEYEAINNVCLYDLWLIEEESGDFYYWDYAFGEGAIIRNLYLNEYGMIDGLNDNNLYGITYVENLYLGPYADCYNCDYVMQYSNCETVVIKGITFFHYYY